MALIRLPFLRKKITNHKKNTKCHFFMMHWTEHGTKKTASNKKNNAAWIINYQKSTPAIMIFCSHHFKWLFFPRLHPLGMGKIKWRTKQKKIGIVSLAAWQIVIYIQKLCASESTMLEGVLANRFAHFAAYFVFVTGFSLGFEVCMKSYSFARSFSTIIRCAP